MRSIHDYVIDLRVVSEDEAMLYLEACSGDRNRPYRIHAWFNQCARIRWGMLTRAAPGDREELRAKWAECARLGEAAEQAAGLL